MESNQFNKLRDLPKIFLLDEKGFNDTRDSSLRNVRIGGVTKFVTRNRRFVQKKNDFLLPEDHIFPSGDVATGN